ncbi:hypothetical protein B0J18DRAFT_37582 [Chaetomium sp. MPI-SDFR-AT-0129]|nr:hypothetical protein B0J18DRAFT_37582 [Chaetomium sp. MPI-SDFR-AT-0129]
MADDKSQNAANSPLQGRATEPSPAPTSVSAAGSGAGPTATAPTPSSRPLYVPQFTAATQMILKRMKGEPSSLSAALSQASRSSAVTSSIPSATYEDVKRRLVMNMNTSATTIQMPAVPPVTHSAMPIPPRSSVKLPAPGPVASKPTSSAVGMSAIRKVTAGLTASSKPTPPKPAPIKAAPSKILSSESKMKKSKPAPLPRVTSGKRKRTKSQPTDGIKDNDVVSTRSSSFSSSSPEPTPSSAALPPLESSTPTTPVPLAVTKSGRQVLKPAAYNPAAMDAASKRPRPPAHHHGKRTVEQMLCKKCSRMHSPATNQIVFCDGCNDGWHQLCHDPWVADEIVRDAIRGWYCSACAAKKGGNKRQKVEQHSQTNSASQPPSHHHHHHGKAGGTGNKGERPKESWANKPAQQKRAYLSTLSQQDLVGIIMTCLDTHPNLPIFPGPEPAHPPPPPPPGNAGSNSNGGPRSIFAGTTTDGLFPRTSAALNAGSGGGSGSGAVIVGEDDENFDPLAALWPVPGRGMYTRLPPDTDDEARLVDSGDFEAFSGIIYDERGRKVEENGMKV